MWCIIEVSYLFSMGFCKLQFTLGKRVKVCKYSEEQFWGSSWKFQEWCRVQNFHIFQCLKIYEKLICGYCTNRFLVNYMFSVFYIIEWDAVASMCPIVFSFCISAAKHYLMTFYYFIIWIVVSQLCTCHILDYAHGDSLQHWCTLESVVSILKHYDSPVD